MLKGFGGGGALAASGNTGVQGLMAGGGLFGGLADKFKGMFNGGGTPTVPASMVGQVIDRQDVPQVTPGAVANGFAIPPLQYAAQNLTPPPAAATPPAPTMAQKLAGVGQTLTGVGAASQKEAPPMAQVQPVAPAPIAPLTGSNLSSLMAHQLPSAPGNLQDYLKMLRGGMM